MKLECRLKTIDSKEDKASLTHGYHFVPCKKEYSDYVEFKVKGKLADQVMDNLGLPMKVEDTIFIDVGVKGSQKTLKTGKGEAVD